MDYVQQVDMYTSIQKESQTSKGGGGGGEGERERGEGGRERERGGRERERKIEKEREREGGGREREREKREGMREELFVCWLVALRPSNRLVYLRDGSAQTISRAATLR